MKNQGIILRRGEKREETDAAESECGIYARNVGGRNNSPGNGVRTLGVTL
jgi:hypothetical protein